MTPPPLGHGNNSPYPYGEFGGGGVLVDSRGTLDIDR